MHLKANKPSSYSRLCQHFNISTIVSDISTCNCESLQGGIKKRHSVNGKESLNVQGVKRHMN